jgi:ribose transport system substrate-binding protein
MPRALVSLAALIVAVVVVGCGSNGGAASSSSGSTNASSTGGKPKQIVVSNYFGGSDWRQEMQWLAQASTKYPPIAGKANVKVVLSQATSVSSQLASLNDIILSRPSGIIIDPASPTGLNAAIQRACAENITVVSVDGSVTAPCAYNLGTNYKQVGIVSGKWLGEAMHGKGKVFLDRGIPGTSIADDLLSGYKQGLSAYPGISIAGYFNGGFTLGQEQSGVAGLLASHPDVGGVATSGYGLGAIRALKAANHKLVPVAGYSYNNTMVACATTPGSQCMLTNTPPYVSILAIKQILDIQSGKTIPKQQDSPVFYLTNTPYKVPGEKFEPIKLGTNALPKASPGLYLPFRPDFMPQITLADAQGKG